MRLLLMRLTQGASSTLQILSLFQAHNSLWKNCISSSCFVRLKAHLHGKNSVACLNVPFSLQPVVGLKPDLHRNFTLRINSLQQFPRTQFAVGGEVYLNVL